jgi:hypothetical protein
MARVWEKNAARHKMPLAAWGGGTAYEEQRQLPSCALKLASRAV